jgi:hypothetical protein
MLVIAFGLNHTSPNSGREALSLVLISPPFVTSTNTSFVYFISFTNYGLQNVLAED